MTDAKGPIKASDAPPRTKPSNYPEPYFSRMAKRHKQPLGDYFGLTQYGVNRTVLEPGGESALMHIHTKQEEFVYILEGNPTLVTDNGETEMSPGMCVGFPPNGQAHHLINRSDRKVVMLEVGDRPQGDEGSYPNDDIQAVMIDGKWAFTHKDGSAY